MTINSDKIIPPGNEYQYLPQKSELEVQEGRHAARDAEERRYKMCVDKTIHQMQDADDGADNLIEVTGPR